MTRELESIILFVLFAVAGICVVMVAVTEKQYKKIKEMGSSNQAVKGSKVSATTSLVWGLKALVTVMLIGYITSIGFQGYNLKQYDYVQSMALCLYGMLPGDLVDTHTHGTKEECFNEHCKTLHKSREGCSNVHCITEHKEKIKGKCKDNHCMQEHLDLKWCKDGVCGILHGAGFYSPFRGK